MTDISKEVKHHLCTGCAACAMSCHHSAITMQADKRGFMHPIVEKSKCNDCKLCVNICPQINIKDNHNDVIAYAAYNLNEKLRLSSSSGGIFTLLAQYVIEYGGVVYGAAFNEEWKVEHIKAEDIETLNRLRKSKYVQSDPKATYGEAKDDLNRGRLVLYSGTPCQIAGLKKYLRKNYDNLVCVDFVCHGVPSPALWKKVLNQICHKRANLELIDVDFRSKKYGWNNPHIRFIFSDGINENELIFKFSEHNYTRLFDQGISLRQSCYHCQYRRIEHPSDITLGDCWHWKELCPEMNDDKGLSIIMTQNFKGEEFLRHITPYLKIVKINREFVIKYTETEKAFFTETDGIKEYNKLNLLLPFNLVAKVANRRTLKQRIISKIKKMI